MRQPDPGTPRHSTARTTTLGLWRFDSINIYHNHKIKLFSKSIVCDSIGGIDLRGRDLREWRSKSKSTTRKISLHFAGAALLSGWIYLYGNALISAGITAGQSPIKSSGIHLSREPSSHRCSNLTFGTSLISAAYTDLSRFPWTLDKVYLQSGAYKRFIDSREWHSACVDLFVWVQGQWLYLSGEEILLGMYLRCL